MSFIWTVKDKQFNGALVWLFAVNVWGIVTALSNFCRGNMYSAVLLPPLRHRVWVSNFVIALLGFNGAAMLAVTLIVAPLKDPEECTTAVNHHCQSPLLVTSAVLRCGYFLLFVFQFVPYPCFNMNQPSRQSVHGGCLDLPDTVRMRTNHSSGPNQPLLHEQADATVSLTRYLLNMSGQGYMSVLKVSTLLYLGADAGIWVAAHYRYTGDIIPFSLPNDPGVMRCSVCQQTRTNIFIGLLLGCWSFCVVLVQLWVLCAQILQRRQQDRNVQAFNSALNEMRAETQTVSTTLEDSDTLPLSLLLYPKYEAPNHEWRRWIQANNPPSALRGIMDIDHQGWAAAISAAREQCYGKRSTIESEDPEDRRQLLMNHRWSAETDFYSNDQRNSTQRRSTDSVASRVPPKSPMFQGDPLLGTPLLNNRGRHRRTESLHSIISDCSNPLESDLSRRHTVDTCASHKTGLSQSEAFFDTECLDSEVDTALADSLESIIRSYENRPRSPGFEALERDAADNC